MLRLIAHHCTSLSSTQQLFNRAQQHVFKHPHRGLPSCSCLPADSRAIVAKQRSGELRSFGLVAGGLGSLPLLNWLLGLSNMVGAALLAADMEKKQGAMIVQLPPAGVSG
jgi:hypothetical protein